MRKLLRQIARANMQREGIQHPNKRTEGGKSFFSDNWRDYTSKAYEQRQREHARAKGRRARSPRRP